MRKSYTPPRGGRLVHSLRCGLGNETAWEGKDSQLLLGIHVLSRRVIVMAVGRACELGAFQFLENVVMVAQSA